MDSVTVGPEARGGGREGAALRTAATAPKGPMTRRGMIFHPTLGYAIPPPIPLSVARRNARERSRVKTVNSSFECLRMHVPSAARNKKMSKVRRRYQRFRSSETNKIYNGVKQEYDVGKLL